MRPWAGASPRCGPVATAGERDTGPCHFSARRSVMMVAMSLDDIDAQIVTALIRDARASYAVIGNEVGLSAPAVKRRGDRLPAAGAAAGVTPRGGPPPLGWA